MKKSISKTLQAKKLSRNSLSNLQAGDRLHLNNGNATTCGEEPENKYSIEYSFWESCMKSNSPRGGTDFCPFENTTTVTFR
ncbi:hypothetical protein LNP04_10620 [Chryseobacterium sp. C-71]|uniref:hypothetical protein n=1 Tax=Chryseobacterium sp. C-71 TaxID=2893882 RepID=UPI001E60575E|nr:hypothetical protein [Chryseobacterium sp. C-71]UFH30433.1 hypothetical protein LNP04_10620 [Chryseobacterium sp. C-71]